MMARSMINFFFILFLIVECGTAASAEEEKLPPVEVTIEHPLSLHSRAVFLYSGVDDFRWFAMGPLAKLVCTDYNTAKSIIGCFNGGEIKRSTNINGADGFYLKSFPPPNNTTITFPRTGSHGLNYFGFFTSRVQEHNILELWSGDKRLLHFDFNATLALIGKNKNYYEIRFTNPVIHAMSPRFFMNVFCHNCTFDKVVLAQGPDCCFESDNHIVGYFLSVSGEFAASFLASKLMFFAAACFAGAALLVAIYILFKALTKPRPTPPGAPASPEVAREEGQTPEVTREEEQTADVEMEEWTTGMVETRDLSAAAQPDAYL